MKGKRYRVLHYPNLGDGKDIPKSEGPIADGTEDPRIAWEVGHMPGIGAYAIDSWRIFCRDQLMGVESSLGKYPVADERKGEEISGEWATVVPNDKELRAYLRWRWLRCGWEWDPLTGDKKRASPAVMAQAEQGGVVIEGDDGGEVKGENWGVATDTDAIASASQLDCTE